MRVEDESGMQEPAEMALHDAYSAINYLCGYAYKDMTTADFLFIQQVVASIVRTARHTEIMKQKEI